MTLHVAWSRAGTVVQRQEPSSHGPKPQRFGVECISHVNDAVIPQGVVAGIRDCQKPSSRLIPAFSWHDLSASAVCLAILFPAAAVVLGVGADVVGGVVVKAGAVAAVISIVVGTVMTDCGLADFAPG